MQTFAIAAFPSTPSSMIPRQFKRTRPKSPVVLAREILIRDISFAPRPVTSLADRLIAKSDERRKILQRPVPINFAHFGKAGA